MIILRLSILVVLFLLLTPVRAQRVVIVCLHPELMEGGVPALIRQTADLGGAQALVLSRVASSPWRRSPQLSQEQWERSAYLTLNAGARALAPQDIPQGGIERLLRLADVNRGWGYPVVVGLLPEALKARGVQVRYLVAQGHSPVLLAGAPFPERDTRVVSSFRALIQATEFTLQGHSRLLLWLDPRFVAPKHQREMLAVLRQNLTSPSDKLYLLLPIPSSDEAKHGSRLGWVLRLGREDEGVLTSRSTRLHGLITLPDLTATWLAHFGGERLPDELLGSPARCVPDESPSQSVGRLTESMMRQAQAMQEQMGREMKELVVEATAGGGAVNVKMRGDFHVVSIEISPDLVKDGDVEMLQDLALAALGEAHRKVEESLKGKLGGMLPPGLL